jgi:hypothetical protein
MNRAYHGVERGTRVQIGAMVQARSRLLDYGWVNYEYEQVTAILTGQESDRLRVRHYGVFRVLRSTVHTAGFTLAMMSQVL